MAARHERNEALQADPRLEVVSQVRIGGDVIAVAPSVLDLANKSLFDEVAHDLLYGPFGDPDQVRDVAHPSIRILGQRNEDMPIVRQERPPASHAKRDTRVVVPHRGEVT